MSTFAWLAKRSEIGRCERALAFAGILTFSAFAAAATAQPHRVVEVRMVQTPAGATLFDPAGIHISVGDTVRWVQVAGYHSTTAYHPENDHHELRIPENAKPWDSGVLIAEYPNKGSSFEHTFTEPGVYDYFCEPHEMAGMVGRIVVGEPGSGPGTKPFGYASQKHWKVVPAAARQAFPSIADIMAKGMVRSPQATSVNRTPH